MTQENQTEATQTPNQPAKHFLTVMIDMSHSSFAGRGLRARLALAEVLSGLGRVALQGADASIVQDGEGNPIAVYSIDGDSDGKGAEGFKLIHDQIWKDGQQISEEHVSVAASVGG